MVRAKSRDGSPEEELKRALSVGNVDTADTSTDLILLTNENSPSGTEFFKPERTVLDGLFQAIMTYQPNSAPKSTITALPIRACALTIPQP